MMTARGGRELERLIKVWCTISKGTHLGLLGQEGEGDGEEEDEVGVKDILSVLMSGVVGLSLLRKRYFWGGDLCSILLVKTHW